MQAKFQYLVDDNKCCGIWCKIKVVLDNKPDSGNGDGSGEKNRV